MDYKNTFHIGKGTTSNEKSFLFSKNEGSSPQTSLKLTSNFSPTNLSWSDAPGWVN